MFKILSLSVLIPLLSSIIGCGSYQIREYPQLVEKTFSPKRAGVISHQQPLNAEEQKQYKLASVSMMKKFCRGKFKVLSEKSVSEIVGYDTTAVSTPVFGSAVSSGYTEVDKEQRTLIRFECEELSL